MTKIEKLIKENKKLWIEGFIFGIVAIIELCILIFKEISDNLTIVGYSLIFFGLALSSYVCFANILFNKGKINRIREGNE